MNGDAMAATEPSLDIIQGHAQNLRESINELASALTRMEDHLIGPRPEKAQEAGVEAAPSGVLAQLCVIGSHTNETSAVNVKRLIYLMQKLGVPG